MKYFGLKLEESKSRLIEFGRRAEEKRRANGIYILRFFILLFPKQERKVQREKENQQKEVWKEM